MDIIRPNLEQAMGLLGQWVVMRLRCLPDEDGDFYTAPSKVVGIVVPAEGGPVLPRLLLSHEPWLPVLEGFEYQVDLEDILFLRVVPALRGSDEASISGGTSAVCSP